MFVISSEREDYPRISVTDSAMKAAGGAVRADLEGLDELMRREVGWQGEKGPQFHLFGRFQRNPLRGAVIYGRRTAHAQLPATLRASRREGQQPSWAPVQTMIHEGRHLVDLIERPRQALGELSLTAAMNSVAVAASAWMAEAMPAPLNVGMAATFFVLSRWAIDDINPRERRARALHENKELVAQYRDVLRFPNLTQGL